MNPQYFPYESNSFKDLLTPLKDLMDIIPHFH